MDNGGFSSAEVMSYDSGRNLGFVFDGSSQLVFYINLGFNLTSVNGGFDFCREERITRRPQLGDIIVYRRAEVSILPHISRGAIGCWAYREYLEAAQRERSLLSSAKLT